MIDRLATPTGTVTFLFSDIERSTQLELSLGTSAYAVVRERHRSILRAAFSAQGGVEQATEGDSFFVVFASARSAIQAAVEGQRGILAEPWPGEVEVRVRMGLHAGEAAVAGDDLVGYDINRAARITAAAHGSQIIVSGTVRALVADGLPENISIRDLGEHRLKDLRAPEHLAQVLAPGLPDAFPPPRSLDARPNNLPTQLTEFVGRERELDEALRLLRSTRLLTLTGPGGTGKTRLSLQVAAASADDFPGGVWFVPLEPVREVALVASTIARTLGAAESTMRSPLDTVLDLLGDGRVLLVLDNFEQVVEAAPVVAELLRRSPAAAILVTSRAALRISGEQEYPVPGLPAPPDTMRLSEVDRLNLPREVREPDAASISRYESVRLFAARAASVRPGWVLTDADAPSVAAICARLQGMPLAIELAAARVKVLTPSQILDRLGDHLALLSHGGRDLPARQQTLRGAIAWSYDLLEPGARRLFERLSVFVGGCDLARAEAVCGSDEEVGGAVVDGLGDLVDQSLVRVVDGDREPRYVMLDTIRAFAAEQLEQGGEADLIRARHAAAVLDLVESAAPHLGGAEQRLWLDRLELDHDNIRAALSWAIERPEPETAVRIAFGVWRFWQQRGYLREGRARLTDIEDRAWDLPPLLRARWAEAFGGVAYWQADAPAAIRGYTVAMELWRELGDPRELANALYNRSYASLVPVMRGEPSDGSEREGEAMLHEALEIYRGLEDPAGEGNILWALGTYAYFIRSPADAAAWYRRSLERHRAAGRRTMEGWSMHMLALAVIRLGAVEEARGLSSDALRVFHEATDIAGITLVLDDLALIAVLDGDHPRAGRLWGAARLLQSTTGADLATYNETMFESTELDTPRDALDPADLERYGAEGAALSLDEVVAYALGEAAPSPWAVP